eukprot:10250012-Karenia_brevis.AAC.1
MQDSEEKWQRAKEKNSPTAQYLTIIADIREASQEVFPKNSKSKDQNLLQLRKERLELLKLRRDKMEQSK